MSGVVEDSHLLEMLHCVNWQLVTDVSEVHNAIIMSPVVQS